VSLVHFLVKNVYLLKQILVWLVNKVIFYTSLHLILFHVLYLVQQTINYLPTIIFYLKNVLNVHQIVFNVLVLFLLNVLLVLLKDSSTVLPVLHHVQKTFTQILLQINVNLVPHVKPVNYLNLYQIHLTVFLVNKVLF
jgi:hypothetical protein